MKSVTRILCLAMVMVAGVHPQLYAGTPVVDVDIILHKIPGGIIFDVTGGVGADEICAKLPKKVTALGVRGDSWTFSEGEKGMICAHGAAVTTSSFVVAFDIDEMRETQKLDFRISADGVVLYQKKGVTPSLLPPIEPITDLGEALAFPEEIEPGQFIQARVLKPDLTPPGGTWKFSDGLSGTVIEERPEEEEEEAPIGATSDPPDQPTTPAEASDPDTLTLWVPNEFGSLSGTVVDDEEEGESTGEDDPASLFAIVNNTRSNLKNQKPESAERSDEEVAIRQLPRRRGDEAAAENPPEEDIRVSYTTVFGQRVVDAARADEAGARSWAVAMSAMCRTGEDDPASLFAVINGTRSNLKQVRREIAGPTAEEAAARDPSRGNGDEAAAENLPERDIRVSYTDRYGRLVVDAVTTVSVAPPSAAEDLTPAIESGTARAFAGRKGCVCGRFPGPRFWNALTFDGQPLGPPLTASSSVVAFTLAGDISSGPHTVAGSLGAGYSASDQWQFDILQLQGNIDQNQLRTGGSTSMSLRIFGTADATEIRLRNLSPGVISLEGGEDQVISTSGGEVNLLNRTVKAVGPGGFDIQWELTEDWCPCAGPQRFAVSEEEMPVEPEPADTKSKN